MKWGRVVASGIFLISLLGISSSAVTTATLTSGDAAITAAFAVIPKLYVANYNDDTVSVIDGLDGTVITTVVVDASPFSVGTNPQRWC